MAKNNKTEVEKLKTEIERLRKELKKRKKYGLVWENKPEDVVELCKEKLPVLKEAKSKDITTDKNKPVNLLIEGDNYHVLSVLNYTHAKNVDVIYIDPPYNKGTGDKFIYNNKIVDIEDGYRHSKWLSFMSKRLRLAKNLLKKDGIIFISINDAEQVQLKLLCDEIFREKNYVGMLIWKNKAGGGGKQRPNVPIKDFLKKEAFVIDHEYILVYAKNIDYIKRFEESLSKDELKKYKNLDNDPRGPYKLKDLEQSIPTPIKTMYYGIKDPDEIIIKPKGGRYQWRFSEERTKKEFKNKTIIWKKIGCKKEKDKRGYYYRPMVKQFLKVFGKNRTKIMRSVLYNMFYTRDGTKEIREIFGERGGKIIFNYPKPSKLIKCILKNTNKREAIILDFFAGSGTTGHAVLELNKNDGNRRFILCTNNENNICTEVCYPRIKKVIKGYNNLKGEKVKGLGGNLKYFKTDFVDAEPTDKNKIKLTQQATEMLCIREGTFEEVLDKKDFKIFKNSDHYTGIIFDQLAIPEFKKTIKDIKGNFSVYVFSLSDETFDEEFADIKQKVKLSPIPEAILRVYRRIFR